MSTPILKNPITNNFFIVPNCPFKDRNLKLVDRGLLATLYSLPDGWNLSSRGLASILSECEDTIQKSLSRLIKAGYIRREQERLKNGRMGNIIYELVPSPTIETTPFPPRPEKPATVNSSTVKPGTEKSPQYNNHNQSDDDETRAREEPDPISEELDLMIDRIIKQIKVPLPEGTPSTDESIIANKIRLKLEAGAKISDLRHYIATCISNTQQDKASYVPPKITKHLSTESKHRDNFSNFNERDDFDWDAYELKLLMKDKCLPTIEE